MTKIKAGELNASHVGQHIKDLGRISSIEHGVISSVIYFSPAADGEFSSTGTERDRVLEIVDPIPKIGSKGQCGGTNYIALEFGWVRTGAAPGCNTGVISFSAPSIEWDRSQAR